MGCAWGLGNNQLLKIGGYWQLKTLNWQSNYANVITARSINIFFEMRQCCEYPYVQFRDQEAVGLGAGGNNCTDRVSFFLQHQFASCSA